MPRLLLLVLILLGIVLLNPPAFCVHQAEATLGLHISLFCQLAPPVHRYQVVRERIGESSCLGITPGLDLSGEGFPRLGMGVLADEPVTQENGNQGNDRRQAQPFQQAKSPDCPRGVISSWR